MRPESFKKLMAEFKERNLRKSKLGKREYKLTFEQREEVAERYFVQGQRQDHIAKALDVSQPAISYTLKQFKDSQGK